MASTAGSEARKRMPTVSRDNNDDDDDDEVEVVVVGMSPPPLLHSHPQHGLRCGDGVAATVIVPDFNER